MSAREHPLRTRFAKDIVCEFLPPTRKSNKVIILATGMPGYPGGRGKALRAFAEKGYWVFVPRYRGTWESGGKFLEKSPHEDILEVARGVSKGFMDFYSGKKMRVAKPKIFVIGASFGGAAVILSSRDSRVLKAVALSPVIDWRDQKNTVEPIEMMEKFIPTAFGGAYRGDKSVWKKLATGNFYSPAHEAKSMKGSKLLIVHAKDDEIVPFAPSQVFAKETGATFIPLRRGGHLGTSSALKPHIWKRIEKFLK